MKKIYLSLLLSFILNIACFGQISVDLDKDKLYEITLSDSTILKKVKILNQGSDALFVYYEKHQRRILNENIISLKSGGIEYAKPLFLATHIIELNDNSKFFAKIISKDSVQLVISTSSVDKIRIARSKIKSIKEIKAQNIKNGKYWFPNPNTTRYFFAPSAFTLKKREGYYQNSYLVINSFNVGITDHITIGGGFEVISFFSFSGGQNIPSFFITPKIGYKVAKNINVAGGVLFANINQYENSRLKMGITYGVGTFGNENHNITFGTGFGFIDGKFSKNPVFTISGMSRISRRVALVSENWIIPSGDSGSGIFSYGVRFFGEKISVDVGFLKPMDGDDYWGWVLGFPYVDFVIKF